LIKRTFAGSTALLAVWLVTASTALAFPNMDQPTGKTCGPTAMAMVETDLTGIRHTPWEIYNDFRGYIPGASKHSLINAVATHYGQFVTYYGPDDGKNGVESSGSLRAGFRDAAASIPMGADVVILFHAPSHFTGGGHFVVLYDYTHKRFRMSDPNRKGRHGDSERKQGWPVKYLLQQGAVKLWVVM
jgi:hypothetical protein